MARINDGLTKSQRDTCMAIFNACKNGTWEKRQVSYEAKSYFEDWLKARNLLDELNVMQMAKFTFSRKKPVADVVYQSCEYNGNL